METKRYENPSEHQPTPQSTPEEAAADTGTQGSENQDSGVDNPQNPEEGESGPGESGEVADKTDPTDPADPETPPGSGPTEPSEPAGPSEPTEPTEPADPTDPTDPAEPPAGKDEPSAPTNPDDTAGEKFDLRFLSSSASTGIPAEKQREKESERLAISLLRMAISLLTGEVPEDKFIPLMDATLAREAITAARAEGEIAGRNAVIEEQLVTPPAGAPDLSGTPIARGRRPAASIFDLADLAR